MDSGVKIQLVEDQNIMGRGVDIPWVGGSKYHGTGSKYHGYGVKIPWVKGYEYHG
jgi:hypothetical protein